MSPIDPHTDWNKVQKWLGDIGIPSTKDTPERLSASIKIKGGAEYTLWFYAIGNDVVIESLAFKAVAGPPEKQLIFDRTLLGYNAVGPISFALVEMGKKDELGIVLRTSISYDKFNPEELVKILDAFNIAFTVHVPNLITLATELGLSFSGKQTIHLSDLVRAILDT